MELFILYGVVLMLIILSIIYLFSSKKFNGYYIKNYQGKYKYYIMMNWENDVDRTAMATYDPQRAIKYLKELNEIGYNNGVK